MNVDCTRKGTLFLPLSLIHFFNDEMHTQFFSLYRVQYPFSSPMDVHGVCVCLFVQSSFSSLLFFFGRDLFFFDVIVVKYNNEHKKEKEKRKIDLTIRITLFFFEPILLTHIHRLTDQKLSKLLLVDSDRN
jgi:hypothetical protein